MVRWVVRKVFLKGRRLKADRSGSAVVEYAIIAAPLGYLIFFLIELVIVSAAQVLLDAAVDSAGRNVFTGSAQKAGLTTSTLKTAICQETGPFLACKDDRLAFELKIVPKFTDITYKNPFDAQGNFTAKQADFANSTLSDAKCDQAVLLRVYYRWPLITPFIGFFMRPNPSYLNEQRNVERILMSTSAFRVEPWNCA